ncbi:SDR family oxidoreductase [Gammaproteobacteria bacterium]|nr:SDR family oxidoreductase [Gammaproteobacteria bacterium]
MLELRGKCVWVTGGAGGLGLAIVNLLVSHGANVVALDKNREALGVLPKQGNLLPILCDLTDEKDVKDAIDQSKKAYTRIDVLINNSGILHSEPLINLSSDERRHGLGNWRRVIENNLTSPFLVTSFVAELMASLRTRGVIVNISSISAQGNPGQTAYAASKAGLDSMTRVWSRELAPLGIRCLSVAPGFMNTGSTKKAITPESLEQIRQRTPGKKLGEVTEVAEMVIALIKNEYVNGGIFNVDGGLVI